MLDARNSISEKGSTFNGFEQIQYVVREETTVRVGVAATHEQEFRGVGIKVGLAAKTRAGGLTENAVACMRAK